VAWYPPREAAPPGTPHGAGGVCLAGDEVVLITVDGETWDLPAGRPELGERPVDALPREVREEVLRGRDELHAAGIQPGDVRARSRALTGARPIAVAGR
jgi:hypothetical protein